MTESGIVEGRVEIEGAAEIEYRVIRAEITESIVFLHDGLGAVGTWRDFPETVAQSTRRRCVVYSREGHGQSSPVRRQRDLGFMHHEAQVVLPALLEKISLTNPILVGHSDGASIALLHAGGGSTVEALVLIAPHVFVEPETITGVEDAVRRFKTTDLPQRMARYHRDPEATFRAWSEIWLDPSFRDWNIEGSLPNIHCPVLLIQALDDEYGTTAQVEAIERSVAGPVEKLVLAVGGHSPHLSRREWVNEAITRFVMETGPTRGGAGH